jgi:hypothetical protein
MNGASMWVPPWYWRLLARFHRNQRAFVPYT